MPPAQDPPGSTADDLNLGLLAYAYPHFKFALLMHGWHGPRWLAVRKNGADPGLYAVVTNDPDELVTALAHDAEHDSRERDSETGNRP